MSNYIVLVKQVPDVTQISDNAFDPETGNLIRTRLASVINELDTQALAFAKYMKIQEPDEAGKIIALTMGPPMAEEVLRYSLSRCADTAILLTDKALGGADTYATANPLAFAIRKIVREILKEENYYVITGMQSVDGDTAQVPAQIAEELGTACIAYVTDAKYIKEEGEFQFTGIISGGSRVVRPRKKPAVITVAKYEYPLFASFAMTRQADKMEIIQWSGDDIKATNTGVKGSKTRVIRVFPPGKSSRKCRQIKTVESLAEILVGSFKENNSQQKNAITKNGYIMPKRREKWFDRTFEGIEKDNEDYAILADKIKTLGIESADMIDEYTKQQILDIAGGHFHKNALEDMIAGLKLTEASYTGEVWVTAEQHDGVIHPATFELVGKARELANSLETKAGVCLAGDDVEKSANELIAAGADNIYLIENKLLSQFDAAVYRKAIADCIEKYRPQIVLFAATPQGRALAPMVSYRLECGLTADCTGLEIKDSSRKGQIGILFQTRPALGGNVMATICTKDSWSQMATARPGVMKRLDADPSRTGKIIKHRVSLSEKDLSINIIKTEVSSGQVNFEADVIVSGGKGMQNRDNYERIVGALCECLSKKLETYVERGASRAAVEYGFIERIHQVGQTGTSVGPKIYIALGISGAIQHMTGVANCETIIAVNNDPNAPIFKQCDYYIVGNVETVVPDLINQLKAE
jgi:electron transfer flavoprotein alpha subunit